MYFFDSSALAKLFVTEQGSESLARLFEPLASSAKNVSSLGGLEIRSAIRRRQRSGDLTDASAEQALSRLHDELSVLMVHPLSNTVLDLASGVVDRSHLRTLDALQLATAILITRLQTNGQSLRFVASDQKLLEAAKAEGLDTWDPTD